MQENESGKTPVIDVVCNLLTPEIVESRPKWLQTFHTEKIGVDIGRVSGLSVDQHVELLDAAGIDRAFLIAVKMGRKGLPVGYQMDMKYVVEAVQRHPDRFSGLIGVDPFSSLAGLREMERAVSEYGFVGAHLYPHWFEMEPDHRRYYPIYSKCAELDVPIQMQVGHCLRYTEEHPLRSVGRPILLDTIACEIPEVKLVGIHIGWPWTEEMIAVAYKHPNVYIATDAYAPKYWDEKLVHFINTFGKKKVLFGSDWPVIAHERAVREVRELGLRDESYSDLMGGNAARLYGL